MNTEAGLWDEHLCPWDDNDFFCRMALRAEVHFFPEQLYYYRIHGAQSTANPDKVGALFAVFRQKWFAYQPHNASEAATLRHAHRFYYCSVRPFREFQVARLALADFLRQRRLANLRWAWSRIVADLRALAAPLPKANYQSSP